MAAPTKDSASNSNTQSYSAMAVGDVEAIGAHCQLEYCHQLDFLPFKCGSCHGTFCLDHRSETAHKCAHEGAWARARAGRNEAAKQQRAPTSMLDVGSRGNSLAHKKACARPDCKTLIDTPLATGVQCTRCNRRYCLKHRMQEDHACATLTPLGARVSSSSQQQTQQQAKERGLAALTKLKSWSLGKKAALTSTTSSAAAALVSRPSTRRAADSSQAALNALKGAAKGDAKVPTEKRVYLHVEASADTTKAKFPTGKFFYSREWSVGRVLDVAARTLQVENVNNRVEGEAEKLRVFHVEGGRLLEFSEKLGDVAQTGNTLVLLRGVGPPVPDLIQP